VTSPRVDAALGGNEDGEPMRFSCVTLAAAVLLGGCGDEKSGGPVGAGATGGSAGAGAASSSGGTAGAGEAATGGAPDTNATGGALSGQGGAVACEGSILGDALGTITGCTVAVGFYPEQGVFTNGPLHSVFFVNGVGEGST
jgi:hypothetical protein